MSRISLFASIKAGCAAAAIAVLAGCSGYSTSVTSRTDVNAQARHRHANFYACPANGPIEYVSDSTNGVINVFAGKFAGQSACGQISSGITEAVGMTVQESTHDLYVANWKGGNVLVFHRGQTTPYNSYVDPAGQYPSDVAISKDGVIAASNSYCSISTWIAGPNGGAFVGSFAKADCRSALDITFLTIKDDDTVYYMSDRPGPNRSRLWAVACPAGVCGVATKVPRVVFDFFPAGIVTDDTGDIVAIKSSGYGKDNDAATYELPNPKPISIDLENGDPFGLAVDEQGRHLFVADPQNDSAYEYAYPGGTLLGMVPGSAYGFIGGIAADD